MNGKYLYLIDGHNLIPKIDGLSLQMENDELELVKRLQIFARIKRAALEVFFDQGLPGYSGSKRSGLLIIHFVKKGISADQEIIIRMNKLKKRSQSITVVTSDRQIIAEASSLKIKTIRSEDFALSLQTISFEDPIKTLPLPPLLSEAEVQDWLKIFKEKKL